MLNLRDVQQMSNKKTTRLFTLVAGILLLATLPAVAEEPSRGWAMSLGFYDFIGADKAVEAGVEYRFQSFKLWKFDLKPVVGVAATEDENFWGYAGLAYDFRLSERWTATPQFAVGLYEKGEGKELGGVVEFRSGLEISRRLKSGVRIGLLLYHLSNARLYDLNPGSESLVITWSRGH